MKNKRIFLGVFLVHLAAYLLLVRAPIQPDVSTIQNAIQTAVGNKTVTSGVKGNVVTLGAVLGSTGSTQQNATVAAAIILVVSLAYIWVIRQRHNDQKIKARDAYYQGMTPVLPVVIIVIVLALQLLPFALASFVYSLARSGGIFVTGFEDLSFFTLTLLFGLLSGYLMTSSVIALYIVTLPGMYPGAALKSARQLVKFRRLRVFRRIVGFPLLVGAMYLVLLLLMIRFIPGQTFIVVELLQLLLIPLLHTYYYKLYRALL